MKPSCERIRRRLAQGWISNYDLVVEYGTEALRRLREIRAAGYPVEMERLKRNGKASNTFRYRLKPQPDTRQCEMKFDQRGLYPIDSGEDHGDHT